MTKLISILRLDFCLQYRYKFYHAAAFIMFFWIALLVMIPTFYLERIVPFVIFMDLGVIGFYFIAGQIIFEKTERTIYALLLTPLTFKEYLTSKLITFTIMALFVSTVVTVISYGTGISILLLSTAVILTSFLFLLIGIIAVLPYKSISTFIIPSQLYVIVFYLPLINYFGWYKSAFFYLVPTQGSLILLNAAFKEGIATSWHIIYAICYMIIWIIVLSWFAKIRFEKYIAAGGRGGEDK